MPPVDRNLLRVAIFEMMWCDDVQDAVAINEAVELAQPLSTDDSPRFVNGVLGKIQLVRAAAADVRLGWPPCVHPVHAWGPCEQALLRLAGVSADQHAPLVQPLVEAGGEVS